MLDRQIIDDSGEGPVEYASEFDRLLGMSRGNAPGTTMPPKARAQSFRSPFEIDDDDYYFSREAALDRSRRRSMEAARDFASRRFLALPQERETKRVCPICGGDHE